MYTTPIRKRKVTELRFNSILILIMAAISFVTLYPFIYALAYSLSDSNAASINPITFYPIEFTLEHYVTVFRNKLIFNGFLISVGRTVAGTLYSGVIVALAGYAISKINMPFHRTISYLLIIPMYVSGGLLPSYVINYQLGLFNSFWIFILPHGFWAFNMLIMRTFFDALPQNLIESAKIDGASEYRIFFQMIIPLSMPVIATIAMFNGVWQWNSWFDVQLYISNNKLWTLSYSLQQILRETMYVQLSGGGDSGAQQVTSPESMKMATLIVATLPIVLVYPFLQRYFIKGFLIGAVKG